MFKAEILNPPQFLDQLMCGNIPHVLECLCKDSERSFDWLEGGLVTCFYFEDEQFDVVNRMLRQFVNSTTGFIVRIETLEQYLPDRQIYCYF